MKKLALAVIVASVAVAGVAQAKSGVYVEGAGGWVQQKSDALDNLTGVDKHHIGGRADIGYNYDINQNFGLGGEFGWGYYGKTMGKDDSGADGEAKSSAFDLLAVATAHVTPQFDIFGKAGVARNSFKAESKTHNNYDPMVAIGAGYNFTPSMQANLTYSHIFGSSQNDASSVHSDGSIDAPSINAVMVGLKYSF